MTIVTVVVGRSERWPGFSWCHRRRNGLNLSILFDFFGGRRRRWRQRREWFAWRHSFLDSRDRRESRFRRRCHSWWCQVKDSTWMTRLGRKLRRKRVLIPRESVGNLFTCVAWQWTVFGSRSRTVASILLKLRSQWSLGNQTLIQFNDRLKSSKIWRRYCLCWSSKRWNGCHSR